MEKLQGFMGKAMSLKNLLSQTAQKLPFANTTTKIGSIGIDFGIERISLVQLNRTAGDFKINAASSVPYPVDRETCLHDPFALKAMLKDNLKSHSFHGKQVIAALPPTLMQLLLVNYQCSRGQDHKTTLMKAISEQFNDKIQGSVVDYIPIRPKVEEQLDRSALVAIAKHDEVTHFLETMRLAGLNTRVLEIGPVAIKRLLTNLDGQDESLRKVMSINFGCAKSFVTVLWGGELLLDREIPIGQDCIVQSVCEGLNINTEQANQLLKTHGFNQSNKSIKTNEDDFFKADINSTLMQIINPMLLRFIQEIKKVLIYTAAETRGGALDKIYILGSIARWPMVDQYLSELINLPIETINPFFGFSVNDLNIELDEIEPVSGIAVATGLALHGLDSYG